MARTTRPSRTRPGRPTSATYAQAQIAYSVAYQQYAQTASSSSNEWTNYVNGILSAATIQIATLGA